MGAAGSSPASVTKNLKMTASISVLIWLIVGLFGGTIIHNREPFQKLYSAFVVSAILGPITLIAGILITLFQD